MKKEGQKGNGFHWLVLTVLCILFILSLLLLQSFYPTYTYRLLEEPYIYYVCLPLAGFLLSLLYLWKAHTSGFRKILTIVFTLLFGVILAFALGMRSPGLRHQLVRFEALHRNLHLSDPRSSGKQRVELNDELLTPIGPRIASDKPLLQYLVFEHGEEFSEKPLQAQIAYAGLRALGVDYEEIAATPQGTEFLGAVLRSEADTRAWEQLEEYPKPELHPSPEDGLYAGLLEASQAREIVASIRKRDGDSASDLLMYYALSFPQFFSENERERMWTDRITTFSNRKDLLESAVQFRKAIQENSDKTTPLKVSVDVGYHVSFNDVKAKRDHLEETIRRSVMGLVRISRDKVTFVKPEEADLIIHATLFTKKAWEEWRAVTETYWERKRSPLRFGRYGATGTSTRRELKTKVVGQDKVSVSFPSINLELQFAGEEEEYAFPSDYIFWYDIMKSRYHEKEKEERDYEGRELNWSKLYDENGKRMWPAGIPQTYYHIHRPDDSY